MAFSGQRVRLILACMSINVAAISGCGGGGGSGRDGTQASRASSIDFITVEESADIPKARYVAKVQDNRARIDLDTDSFDYMEATSGPTSNSLAVRIEAAVSRTTPSKYAIKVAINPRANVYHAFTCYSGNWPEREKARASEGVIAGFDTDCSGISLINHRVQITQRVFEHADTPGSRIGLSADVSWTPGQAISAPIQILEGSSSVLRGELKAGDFWIMDPRSGWHNQTFRGSTLEKASLDTWSKLAMYIHFRADDRSKFIIDIDNEARPGTRHMCTSRGWSAEELQRINATADDTTGLIQPIPPCPEGVVYNPGNRTLTLNKVSLPALGEPQEVLMVYYSATWLDMYD